MEVQQFSERDRDLAFEEESEVREIDLTLHVMVQSAPFSLGYSMQEFGTYVTQALKNFKYEGFYEDILHPLQNVNLQGLHLSTAPGG